MPMMAASAAAHGPARGRKLRFISLIAGRALWTNEDHAAQQKLCLAKLGAGFVFSQDSMTSIVNTEP
jgi:hypothetical protein